MKISEKVLKTLEYNKVIDVLKTFAISSIGKTSCENLSPINNAEEIKKLQAETTEAVVCITKKGSLPLGGISDVAPHMRRVEAGGVLNIQEIINVADLIHVVNKVMKYSNKVGAEGDYKYLDPIFDSLCAVPYVLSEINRCIVNGKEIDDNATPELYQIRREKKGINNKIKEHLQRIMQSEDYRSMLQDNVVSLKNDRLCLSVRAEFKNSFKGLIHDQSGTGQTVFIEPMVCVDLNNRLVELTSKERREEEKILAMLSSNIFENKDLILINLDVLTKLDVIFARGQLSIKLECIEPEINTDGITTLKKARHPLIDKSKVVPIDIYIGDNFSVLLITGPNTGGKTVSLKTLGLLNIMAQSGLHIPANHGSSVNVFDDVFADIGDEQSIEQSLSTFSSHMTNIVDILSKVKSNTLVLFDELGAGTDPVEGAVLAISILKYVYDVGATTCVTTHYPELKAFALTTEGVENASCEFDVESLKPTYKLLIGVPGKSNAFAISKRLGLDDSIIDEAKKLVAEKDAKFEDLVTDLEISKKKVEEEKQEAEAYRLELAKIKSEFETEKEKLNKQKDDIIIKARTEARKITQDAKTIADEIVRDMKKMKDTAKVNEADQSRQKLQNEISSHEDEIAKQSFKTLPKSNVKFKKGDKVYINSMRTDGVLVTDPDAKGDVSIACGIMKIKGNVRNLQLLENQAKQPTQPKQVKTAKKGKVSKAQNIKSELNIIGMTAQEGVMELEKYIDDAVMTGLSTLRIVHGKGSGVLRKAVHEHLRRNKAVKSYRIGEYGEGDFGVTIVELK